MPLRNGHAPHETDSGTGGVLHMVITPEHRVQIQITDGERPLHTMQFTAEEGANLAMAILQGLIFAHRQPDPSEEVVYDA